jgi:hypothetical protein
VIKQDFRETILALLQGFMVAPLPCIAHIISFASIRSVFSCDLFPSSCPQLFGLLTKTHPLLSTPALLLSSPLFLHSSLLVILLLSSPPLFLHYETKPALLLSSPFPPPPPFT